MNSIPKKATHVLFNGDILKMQNLSVDLAPYRFSTPLHPTLIFDAVDNYFTSITTTSRSSDSYETSEVESIGSESFNISFSTPLYPAVTSDTVDNHLTSITTTSRSSDSYETSEVESIGSESFNISFSTPLYPAVTSDTVDNHLTSITTTSRSSDSDSWKENLRTSCSNKIQDLGLGHDDCLLIFTTFHPDVNNWTDLCNRTPRFKNDK
ncbi:hypothetical protein J6590_043726 [Homalodisca vitripennis]|nr:hypothetical protein J6590_043726 [Homalodisca vitripennis]